MTSVARQTLRCLIHESRDVRKWEILLPIVEMVINSLPNQSTGFSPFYLNYGHELVMPLQLIRGNESISTKSVASFISTVTSDWELAKEDLQRSVGLQYSNFSAMTHGTQGEFSNLQVRRDGKLATQWSQ